MSSKQPRLKSAEKSKGFTLIEISIVLVIIGLLVGGVLVGRDLIAAAQVRAQISQIEKYQQAVNTFKGKYDYLPGDIKDPEATQFGFRARSGLYTSDGNGIVEGASAGARHGGFQCGETALFWADLNTALLIEGKFTQSCISAASQTAVANQLPSAAIGAGNNIYAHSDSGINYFGMSQVIYVNGPGSIPATKLGLSVAQAYSIDSKMDDGYPQSGKITALFLNYNAVVTGAPYSNCCAPVYAGASDISSTAPSLTTCYDNNSVAGARQQYSITQNNGTGVNCALSFQFQ